MIIPTTDAHSRSTAETPPSVGSRSGADARLAGVALMAGCVLTAIGFVALSLAVRATGDARYTNAWWQPLYGVVLAGSILVVLGLPAVLAVHRQASRRLTLVGYVGLYAPLVMLHVAETAMEAFIKPYLAAHGGIPAEDPTGLSVFETVALVLLLVGTVCLAIAVFRARTMPRWVGVALIASLVAAFALPHTGPAAFISDYCVFAALFAFGFHAVRTENNAGD
jgi:hypothetical protein